MSDTRGVNGKLSQRQIEAIEHFLRGETQEQACILAGFGVDQSTGKCTNASTFFGRPQVQEELNRRRKLIQEQNIVTTNDVLRGIVQIAKFGDDEGNRLKAWIALSKILGMQAPRKVEITNAKELFRQYLEEAQEDTVEVISATSKTPLR